MQNGDNTHSAPVDKTLKQLELYARDLQELYWQERQKRNELATERLVLQYKLRELEGLNKLFQKDMEQRIEIEKAYSGLLEGIKKLLREAGDLRAGLQHLILEAEAGQADTLSSEPGELKE